MSKYINLIDKLSNQDKLLITKYIDKYGCKEEYFIGVDQWLQHWSHANQKLYHLLGDQFIYEFEYEYEKTSEILRKEISDLLSESTFTDNFQDFLRTVIEDKYYNKRASEDKNTILSLEDYRFFIHLYCTPEFACNETSRSIKFKKPGARKMLQIQVGTKIFKALNQVMNYFADEFDFNKEAFEELRKKHAIIFSEKRIKGTACISIHPLDYITMSDNDSNWSSCMSWIDNGCYHVGTIEMMNSNNVLCCYLKDKKSPFEFAKDENTGEVYLWNNKRWRSLFYITKDILMSGKPYPYVSEPFSKDILNKIKTLAEQNLNWKYQFGPELYQDMKHIHGAYRMNKQKQWMKAKSYIKHNILWDTKGMYNDMLNDPDTKYWCYRNKVDHTKIISISGKTACLCCGEPSIYEEWSNDYNDYNDRWQNSGNVVCCKCESSKFKCSYCLSENHYQKIYTLPDNTRICEDCVKKYLHECPECHKIKIIDTSINNIYYNPFLYNYLKENNEDKQIYKFDIRTIQPIFGGWHSNLELDKELMDQSSINDNYIELEKLYCCQDCRDKIKYDIVCHKKNYWSRRNDEIGLLTPEHAQKYRWFNLRKASLEEFIAEITRRMAATKELAT